MTNTCSCSIKCYFFNGGSFKVTGINVLFMILYMMISIALPILSIIFADSNSEMSCDTSSIIYLDHFLIGSAILQFIIIGLIAITFIFIYMCGCNCHFNPNKLFRGLLIVESIIYFILANIGAVSLFRDSMSCLNEAPELWGMSLTVIIYYWISLGYNFIVGVFYIGAT